MPELPQPTQPDQTIEIPDLGPIKTKHVVSMPSWTSRPTTTTARGLLILNNPVSLSAVHTVSLRNTDVEATKPTDQGPEATTEHKQAETALIVFPPVEDRGCVRAVMHGQGTFTAPDGYCEITRSPQAALLTWPISYRCDLPVLRRPGRCSRTVSLTTSH